MVIDRRIVVGAGDRLQGFTPDRIRLLRREKQEAQFERKAFTAGELNEHLVEASLSFKGPTRWN